MMKATGRDYQRDLNLNLLMTLDVLLKKRHISTAAKVLGVAQPTVSNNLRKLRAYFDDPLLVRAGAHLRPTSLALELEEAVDRIARDIHASIITRRAFVPAEAERSFTICLTDMAEFLFLQPLLAEMKKTAPHCRVNSLQTPVQEMPALLEAGHADIAVGALGGMPATLRQRRLFDIGWACIARRGHPRVAGTMTRTQYVRLDHVVVSRTGDFRDVLVEPLRRHGIVRRIAAGLSHHLVAARLVAETDLIATLPRVAAELLATYFPLQVLAPPVRLSAGTARMFWHERFHRDPANLWFRRLAAIHCTIPA